MTVETDRYRSRSIVLNGDLYVHNKIVFVIETALTFHVLWRQEVQSSAEFKVSDEIIDYCDNIQPESRQVSLTVPINEVVFIF